VRSLQSPPRTFRSHAISSILYQRGIYPPETFTRVEKYGLGMLVTKEDGLKNYLNNVLKQLKGTVLGALPSRSISTMANLLCRLAHDRHCGEACCGNHQHRHE
jgi:mitotic spindle assembly checkpoint protein MAD2